jgi:hypothetical protein
MPDTGTTAAWAKVRLAGLRGHRQVGEGAHADPIDLVADGEPGDRRAHGGNNAGDVPAEYRLAGSAEADGQADRVRLAGHQMPGAPVQAGGVDS